MTLLNDDLLNLSEVTRPHAVNQALARRDPGIPIVDHQLDVCRTSQASHLMGVGGGGRHWLFDRIMDVALGALAENRKVLIVRCRDHDGIRLGLVEHLHKVIVEKDARWNAGLGERHQLGVWVGDGHQLNAGLGRDVMQQPPDMVVVEVLLWQSAVACPPQPEKGFHAPRRAPPVLRATFPTCVILRPTRLTRPSSSRSRKQ